MTSFIDPSTMFFALLVSTLAATALLFWSFWLNRGQRSLLFSGLGFLTIVPATAFLAARFHIPLATDLGLATLLFGNGLLWTAARVFNGRPAPLWPLLVGPGILLAIDLLPLSQDGVAARIVVSSSVAAVIHLLVAREFWVRDGLLTRHVLSAVLVVHAVLVLLRIPVSLIGRDPGLPLFAGPWFGPIALEAAIYIQIVAFLMVSLAKERVEARLRLAAFTDPLTGLGNRRDFFERSQPIFADNARHGRPSATIVFDLDRFKEVNDRHGHPVGDAVIQAFAATAKRFLRPGDLAGRLGGEEFAITLPDTTTDNARQVAERITRAFEQAVTAMSGQGLHCTASAGVVSSPTTTHSLDELLWAADQALYEAKGMGGGIVRLGQLPGRTESRAA